MPAPAAPAATPAAQLVVAYAEAPAAAAAAVRDRVRDYARSLSAQAGGPQVEFLQEVHRPQRMAVIERWPAGASVPADGALAATLGNQVQAPVDRRAHRALGSLLAPTATAPFHMLMHVDVVPAGAPLATQVLDAQRGSVMAAPGARGFEMAIQEGRANHFAVHETWASRAAYETYAASPPAMELRRQLATVKGALFDDRFYVPVAVAGRKAP